MSSFTAEAPNMSYERTTEDVQLGDLTSQSVPSGPNNTYGSSTQRRHRGDIPEEVEPDREDGTEEGCRLLARTFFERYGYSTLSKFRKRGELSTFYLDTFPSWSNGLEPRHFKQVLFALCVDGRVCRVVGDRGKFIKWNNYKPRHKNGNNQRRGKRSQGGSRSAHNAAKSTDVSSELIAKITAAVIAAQNADS